MSDTDATQVRQDVAADVDEILEHVINGNMPSMPYDVYVELFDAVAGLGVEIENLQAENAKLREEFDKMDKWHSAELIAEMAENAKLRELARKLAWCAVVSDCGACEGACEDGDEWPAGSAICTAVDHMMCELGVEVDE